MTGCFGDFGLFFDFKEGFIIPLGSNLMIKCLQSLLFCNVTLALRWIHSSPFIFFSESSSKRPKEKIFTCVTLPDAHLQQFQVFYQAHHLKDKLKSCFAISIVIFVWSLPVCAYSCGHIKKLSCSCYASLGCSPADLPSQIQSECLSSWLASCTFDIHLGVCFVGNFTAPGAWNMRYLCTRSVLGQNPHST